MTARFAVRVGLVAALDLDVAAAISILRNGRRSPRSLGLLRERAESAAA